MAGERYRSFAEFWPYYLGEHARGATRLLHFVGTTAGAALSLRRCHAALGFDSGHSGRLLRPRLAVALTIERNRPATFTYPLWYFLGDWKMLFLALTGRLGRELARLEIGTMEKLRRGDTIVNSVKQGSVDYYDVWVPLQMPNGVRGPGGLRLLLNPADWTGLVAGLWRQLILLFVLGGGVALISGIPNHGALHPPLSLDQRHLAPSRSGNLCGAPQYASHDEVGASLDLIDRLVMKQRKNIGLPAPVQRLAIAAARLPTK